MFLIPWFSQSFLQSRRLIRRLFYADVSVRRPSFIELASKPDELPDWVRDAPVAMRYLRFLKPLDWQAIPPRSCATPPQASPLPYGPFLAACVVKVDQHIDSMTRLRTYLVDHPALTWLLGFPLVPSQAAPWGFDVEASLPTARHFTRMLRTLPNAMLQGLLDSTVTQLKAALPAKVAFGEAISLDTKHILAWVKENNPKAYVDSPTGRYDPARQPVGDPDCRLGCKKRRNQQLASPPTPLTNPVPASTVKVGTWYWGYGSGVVATKVPGWGEFVLAELTQPFNRADVTYYFPLMAATTRRLGAHPRYGAFDAAFDAWYVYADFHNEGHDGFAAVPLVARSGKTSTAFNDDGCPRCQAGLSMPLRSTFWSTTSTVPHEKGRYGCPLDGDAVSSTCPVGHKNWPKGGCTTTVPTSIGARLRVGLNRESAAYKDVYRQRTATERVNSQAVKLGIERPRLRNGNAIANHNTLIYLVINLRALQRVQQHKGEDPIPSETGSRQS